MEPDDLLCSRYPRSRKDGGLPIRAVKATLVAFFAFLPMNERVCRSLLDLAMVCSVLRIRGTPTNHEVSS
jgi:hypothetical protein